MKEIPILMSTSMVQAIIANRKTNTRRTRGLDKVNKYPDDWLLDGVQLMGSFIFHNKITKEEFWIKSPFGKPGDLLWVRESYCPGYFDDGKHGYKADWNNIAAEYVPEPKWKPSIHMPKAAARIWLKVTDIRIERLQDISEEDAIAEGVERIPTCHWWKNYLNNPLPGCSMAKESFKTLWKSINGLESWNKNPWVWVIKFEVVSKTGKPNL